MSLHRQRIYATLLAAGALFLFTRTVIMIAGGSLTILVIWVAALLVAECVLDLTWLIASMRWWWTGKEMHSTLPLRLAGSSILLHVSRVLVFALGRVGPWIDFDVRPEERAVHVERWTWGEVRFATVMSLLAVLGVVTVWYLRRRKRAARPG